MGRHERHLLFRVGHGGRGQYPSGGTQCTVSPPRLQINRKARPDDLKRNAKRVCLTIALVCFRSSFGLTS